MTYQKLSSFIIFIVVELILFYVLAIYWQVSWMLKGSILALSIIAIFCTWLIRQRKNKENISIGSEVWQQIATELNNTGFTERYVLHMPDSEMKMSNLVERYDDTVYINIFNPEHLYTVVWNLLQNIARKQILLSIELVLSPAINSDVSMVMRGWLRNILFLQKKMAISIPVSFVIRAPVIFKEPSNKRDLFFALKTQGRWNVLSIKQFFTDFKESLSVEFLQQNKQSNGCQYIWLIEALNCVEEQLLNRTDGGWEYVDVRSLSVVDDGGCQAKSAWATYISKSTQGLVHSSNNYQGNQFQYIHIKLPDKYAVYHKNHAIDILFKVLSVCALGFLSASFFSMKNNSRLIEQISQHIENVRSEANSNERQQHLVLLKQDLQLLEKYRDEGVPAYLGLGLYRADLYIPKLKALMPKDPPPPKPIKPEPVKPVVITLDSLALFETGQFELKNNANKALIGALKAIESHPDTRILVEGHTDNVGNPVSNQQLSEKRAQSVKDWLVISSNVPESRFEVKGLGDAKPIADNQTEEGKAKNRRVEIILIPAVKQ